MKYPCTKNQTLIYYIKMNTNRLKRVVCAVVQSDAGAVRACRLRITIGASFEDGQFNKAAGAVEPATWVEPRNSHFVPWIGGEMAFIYNSK